MTHYVGIDLGTTNSAICSFDGSELRVWKSPEQNEVTPSALYFDKRGGRHVGRRAYDRSPHEPGRAATLFKRFMGTGNRIELPDAGLSLTPEECSAAVLKTLYGYLPEDIRDDPDTGTVITVPAAFNQMQKDATMQAAELAGIGRVALMQEPVAAVMSVMRARGADGIFVIFDLGGGTLDVAVAESLAGRVNLLAHGGIAMCGGRDWDRQLVDSVVKPWLMEQFDLPADLSADPAYAKLLRLAAWAAEKGKIELSAREDSRIGLDEGDIRLADRAGTELYLDIPLARATLDRLIAMRVDEAIEAARQTLTKQANLTANDVERIVFVGGPTHYAPLRDAVARELAIPGSTEVDPMTAVAAGAALFAESIDWSSRRRERKSARGDLRSGSSLGLSFRFIARTPEAVAKLVVQLEGPADGAELSVDSRDTGWTSGRLPLRGGLALDLPLAVAGENVFRVAAFDAQGRRLELQQDQVVITRTAATVDSIPASHSIGIEVKDRAGGSTVLDWLVRAGDRLPVKGSRSYRAEETLKAGSPGALNFRLWEGEIEDEVQDNRFIGCFRVSGQDFDAGVIAAGAELALDYEILDSGQIVCEVSVPSIRATLRSGSFYSRQDGARALDPDMVLDEARRTRERLELIASRIRDTRLDKAQTRLHEALDLPPDETDSERIQEAMERVLQARRLLAEVRQANRAEIRRMDLDDLLGFYAERIRPDLSPSEARAYDNLVHTAERALERGGTDFERYLDALKGRNFQLLWRQDWFVGDYFRWMIAAPGRFRDRTRFASLAAAGAQALAAGDIDGLRRLCGELSDIQVASVSDGDLLDMANIIRH
jgi:molecular chaperone DnaK